MQQLNVPLRSQITQSIASKIDKYTIETQDRERKLQDFEEITARDLANKSSQTAQQTTQSNPRKRSSPQSYEEHASSKKAKTSDKTVAILLPHKPETAEKITQQRQSVIKFAPRNSKSLRVEEEIVID